MQKIPEEWMILFQNFYCSGINNSQMNSVFQSVILNKAQRSEGSILFANINLWILRSARNDRDNEFIKKHV